MVGQQCLQYLEDTQLYLSFPPNSDAVDVLNQYLEPVMGWMRVNKQICSLGVLLDKLLRKPGSCSGSEWLCPTLDGVSVLSVFGSVRSSHSGPCLSYV